MGYWYLNIIIYHLLTPIVYLKCLLMHFTSYLVNNALLMHFTSYLPMHLLMHLVNLFNLLIHFRSYFESTFRSAPHKLHMGSISDLDLYPSPEFHPGSKYPTHCTPMPKSPLTKVASGPCWVQPISVSGRSICCKWTYFVDW